MAAHDVELYFDLGSPYAYLAVARAEKVLGVAPVLRPVLLGAIFQARGYGSWSLTPQRDLRVAEIERRAQEYGLPRLRWPPAWPPNGLVAMRAAVWAQEQGGLDEFVHAVFAHEFAQGEDISQREKLIAIADEAGLPGAELDAALDSQRIKDRLRTLTNEAWERGVRGVPTIAVGSTLIYGDDQLEQAPLLLAR
ncbi:MAG TPA: 2-hydroxychromene-2-carboxylate isomerase [Thermoleophilaceae bacterium]